MCQHKWVIYGLQMYIIIQTKFNDGVCFVDILEKIEKLRKDRGWSVYKLAEESGVTQSTIANMFSRGTMPSIATLQQLCNAFGISMADFFGGNSGLSIEEEKILSGYRQLNADSKKIIDTLFQTLKNN